MKEHHQAPLTRRWTWSGWNQDWGTVLALSTCVYVLVFFLWQVLGWGGPAYRTLIADMAFLPMNPLAALLTWRAARHPATAPPARRAWQTIALAYLLWWFGDVLWFYHETVLQVSPYPSAADIFYLLFYPVMLWGLLTLPTVQATQMEKVKFWLDSGTVCLAAWMVMWYFIIGPTSQFGDVDLLATALAVAYPVGDLILVQGVATLLLRKWATMGSRALSILAAGLLVTVVGDFSYGYLVLRNSYEGGSWTDSLWMAAQLLMVVSGQVQYWQTSRGVPDSEGKTRRARGFFSLLPYAGVVLGGGVLLAVVRYETVYPMQGLVWGAVGVMVLAVVRQVVVLRDNQRLLAISAALGEELRRNEARFRALVQNSSDVVMVVGADSSIHYQSRPGEQVFGHVVGSMVGTRLLDLVHPDDTPGALALLAEVTASPGTKRVGEWRLRHGDGLWRNVEATVDNLLDNPDVGGLVLNLRDVSERKELEARLRHLAFHDSLTNLANRAQFNQRVGQILPGPDRPDNGLAVLFLDLDEFKPINDQFGHSVGDALLVVVAERLRSCVRPMDVVARFGGDEFAVLLPDTDAAGATLVAQRISDALQVPMVIQGRELSVHVSIGIAVSSGGNETAEDLLRNADIAMYAAKGRIKGGHADFRPSTRALAGEGS